MANKQIVDLYIDNPRTSFSVDDLFELQQDSGTSGATKFSDLANKILANNFSNTIFATHSFTDGLNYSRLKIDVMGSTVAFSADEAGTGVGTLTGYSFDRDLYIPSTKFVRLNPDSGDNTYITGGSAYFQSSSYWGALFRHRRDDSLCAGFVKADNVTFALIIDGDGTLKFGTTASFPALKPTGSDLEIVKADGTAVDTAIILSSPNGTRYRVTVSNVGVPTTTAL